MFGFGKKKKDVVLENELGSFKLIVGKNKSYYNGYAVWHGAEDKILATVNCDENGSADKGFKRLSEIADSSAELEKRLIEYTFDDFIDEEHPDEPIEIWSRGYDSDDDDNDEEPDPMPPEEFKKHISIGFISVEDDGTIVVDMSLDGLFTDHGFMVSIDKDGNITSGALWG